MAKNKILFFLQDGVGGAERVSVLLGKSLPRKQYNVKFCLVDRNSETSIRDFIPKGFPIIIVPNVGPLRMIWKLIRIIHKEHPHTVFSSVMYLNTKILPFQFIFPKTHFVVRCENYYYTFSKKQQQIIKYTYKRADIIIAQTKEMGDELIEQINIDHNKVIILQNPVDTELIDKMIIEGVNPYPQNGKKHFVASGRFAYQKGFDLLLDAFAEVSNKRGDVDLYVVGDYNYQEGKVYSNLIERAKQTGVRHLLHCVGYQKNPYPFIKYADCFVLSSRWEGLPNVLIEALYLGTPVAAFECIPVVGRIVDNGKNGYLASKENVKELCIAMDQALKLGRTLNSYKSSSARDFEEIIESIH